MTATGALAVVEDQRFTRETTVELLRGRYGDRREIAGFVHVEGLLAADPARFAIVVLDLQLRDGGLQGRDAVAAVAQHTSVLVFSGLESGEALMRAREAGAMGYVSKDTSPEMLIDGVEAVLAGDTFVDPELLEKIGASGRKMLTPRQQDVLRLEALGCKLPQIAMALEPPLTEAGVRRHIERIVEIHPDCAKQADRVRLAIDLGLVTPWDTSQRYGTPQP
jgi:DNA-binding NarL/FixJ family response regulator